MAKNKTRKKVNTYLIGQKKQQQNRINLFNSVYPAYMNKSYPVLYRFARMVNSGNIKISFIRKAALEMALQEKMREAIETAKMNMLSKVNEETNGEENGSESKRES
jgi:hypothetical protein